MLAAALGRASWWSLRLRGFPGPSVPSEGSACLSPAFPARLLSPRWGGGGREQPGQHLLRPRGWAPPRDRPRSEPGPPPGRLSIPCGYSQAAPLTLPSASKLPLGAQRGAGTPLETETSAEALWAVGMRGLAGPPDCSPGGPAGSAASPRVYVLSTRAGTWAVRLILGPLALVAASHSPTQALCGQTPKCCCWGGPGRGRGGGTEMMGV